MPWEPGSGSGVRAQIEPSWKISSKRALLQSVFLEGWCRPYCKAGRRVPGLVAPGGPVPAPPSPWGGGSARCSVPIPCSLEKFPRSPPPRPLRAPLRSRAVSPSNCPSRLPAPPPQTCVASPPGPTLFCTSGLSLSGSWRPPEAPSSCPTLLLLLCIPRSRKLPSSSRAAEPGSLQRASQRDGSEWGWGT